MKYLGESLTRAEVERRVGKLSQVGGTRHGELTDGAARGTRVVDVDTAAGLSFTVVPDRGMDISRASFRGAGLAWHGPTGEVHPAYYSPRGDDWIRLFFGGLLTTCGLRSFGPPSEDAGESLGLHGRANVTPASGFADLSHWEGDEYVVELRGTVAESVALGPRMVMERTIRARLGEPRIELHDTVRNAGSETSPFLLLYHVNPGWPLLSPHAELSLTAGRRTAYEDYSVPYEKDALRFGPPVRGWKEQNYLHEAAAGKDGKALACFHNPRLLEGTALWIRWDAAKLPYLSEWKMLGEGDYVVGLEPCNAPIKSRRELREKGTLPFLEPGQASTVLLEMGIASGAGEVAALQREIESVNRRPA